MNSIVLHEGDNRIALRRMIDNGEFVDSVVCDPPYGLKSIIKRFGKEGAAPAKYGKDGAFGRASAGFMGQSWDGTDIENDPEFWKLIYAVMKPGAYLVAFSSPRTYHRMTTAIEDAGFIVHPMIGWCYGSGMPKAHNPNIAGMEGWRYGGQVRKPALEPIFIGQKPFSTRTGRENMLLHGVGAVNIDGVRVATDDNLNGGAYVQSGNRKSLDGDERVGVAQGMFQPGKTAGRDYVQPAGRWPANIITDGSTEVETLFPKTPGAMAPVKGTEPSGVTKDIYGKFNGRVPGQFYGDQDGTAMRFFEQYSYACWECGDSGVKYEGMMCIGDSPSLELCQYCYGEAGRPSPFEGTPIFYVPKAGKGDRAGSSHPTIKPISLIQSLIRHVTPPVGTTLDPFAGSGTTGQAALNEGARCILMENEKPYAEFIRRRLGLKLTADDMLGEVTRPIKAEDLL